MPTHEIEIVFLASDDQLEQLPRELHRVAASVHSRPLRVIRDRYLDTEALLLMRAGVTCRQRQVGTRVTLTLKSRASFRKGFSERVELDEDLAQGHLTGSLPGGVLQRRLRPLAPRLDVHGLFDLIQERRVYEVRTRDGASLEVSADHARLAGSTGEDALQRIEVELRNGSTESLIRFAASLRRRLKLKPAVESKFEVGLRVAGLSVPELDEGSECRLRPRDSVRQAAGRILNRHFSRLLWYEPGARLGINPECLHGMRVSVRRLRAALRQFGDFLPASATARLADDLKWLGKSLGAVRDLDVHLEACSAMLQRGTAVFCRDAEVCRAEMSRRRDRATAAMRRDLRCSRFRDIQETCRELVRRLRRPTAAGSGALVAAGTGALRDGLNEVLKAGRAVSAATPDAGLHRLRIRCKRLRYACDALADVYGKPVAKMATRLAVLQDVLGAHQDAVLALALIAEAGRPGATPSDGTATCAWCAAEWRQKKSAARAVFAKTWRDFDRRKPLHAFRRALKHSKGE